MKTEFRYSLATLLLCGALTGCHIFVDDSEEMTAAPEEMPPPTPEDIARADYARIVAETNVFLLGDIFGYPEGETEARRVPVSCRAELCAFGFTEIVDASQFTLEELELEIGDGPNGVRQVTEHGSTNFADKHVLGGWMTHSFFGSETALWKHPRDPDQGAIRVMSYAIGNATGDNPTVVEGGATWRGFVVGRDGSVVDHLAAVIEGEASIFVDLGPDTLLADVAFTNLLNDHTQQSYDDMTWAALAVTDGGFAHYNAVDDQLQGQFFGPEQGEVAGIFERAGVTGAFGGLRE